MKNKFNVREYVDRVYGNDIVELYEEDYGLNGLDFLWAAKSADEVDDILESYID